MQEKSAIINLPSRIRFFRSCCLICFLLLVARLWYLQIIKSDFFKEKSDNNRKRILYITAPRGVIFDRYGEVLVSNRPAFDIEFIREDAIKVEDSLKNLSKVLGISVETLQAQLKSGEKGRKRYEPVTLVKDVVWELMTKVKARQYLFPGVQIGVYPARTYLNNNLAAHVLGYIREIRPEQLVSPKFIGYKVKDLVGQYGIEASAEYYLQGKRGMRGIIVNALGDKIEEAFFEQEEPGHKLYLTIDAGLQRVAEDALKDKKGTVIAMNPKTGEVLSLVSKPDYDPNLFSNQITATDWNKLVFDLDRPLTNRATQGLYPPGSLFKVITALAALEHEIATPEEQIFCPGHFSMGGKKIFRCHKESGHGSVNLAKALEQSCNVYFYTIGNRLGIDLISKYADLFGFGHKPDLQLGDEASGVVPSRKWKREHFTSPADKQWYPGETPSVSIGQGALSVSAMQVVRAFAALVNGGYLLQPIIIEKIETLEGTELVAFDNSKVKLDNLNIKTSNLKIIWEGLKAVVNAEHGTGLRARLDPDLGVMLGKTGTAQRKSLTIEKKGQHLAWFAGFAPEANPQIVAVAMVEGSEAGGVDAAPVVKSVVDYYLRFKNAN